jgi:hypothetical protein
MWLGSGAGANAAVQSNRNPVTGEEQVVMGIKEQRHGEKGKRRKTCLGTTRNPLMP